MLAYGKFKIYNTTSNNRPCLKAVVIVEAELGSDSNWFAFTVFGFTAEQLQNAAYNEADIRCAAHGWKLDALRRDTAA